MPGGGGLGRWKSERSEREFGELYAELREEAWRDLSERRRASAPEERDVPTRFGPTHVFHWPGEGTPIVLLHGAGSSSLMWAPLIGELVGTSIYAIDGIGDPGLTVQTAPVADRGSLVEWLEAVFDGLGIQRAHTCGASYGGWIAVNAAIRARQRLATLILIEPVLDPLRPYFWAHGLLVGVSLGLPTTLRRRALHRLHMHALADLDHRFSKLGRLGLMQYKRGVPRADRITDEELTSVTTRTLLLLGANSEIHHAKTLLIRARATMPDLDSDLVADAGHSLPLDHATNIAPRIRAFIEQT